MAARKKVTRRSNNRLSPEQQQLLRKELLAMGAVHLREIGCRRAAARLQRKLKFKVTESNVRGVKNLKRYGTASHPSTPGNASRMRNKQGPVPLLNQLAALTERVQELERILGVDH